jgi:hypothetical protein
MQKSTEKWRFLLLLLYAKVFSQDIFWVNFCSSASNFPFYDTRIKFLKKIHLFCFILALFANFKAKRGMKRLEKNEKGIL